jgi:hypothetical protein
VVAPISSLSPPTLLLSPPFSCLSGIFSPLSLVSLFPPPTTSVLARDPRFTPHLLLLRIRAWPRQTLRACCLQKATQRGVEGLQQSLKAEGALLDYPLTAVRSTYSWSRRPLRMPRPLCSPRPMPAELGTIRMTTPLSAPHHSTQTRHGTYRCRRRPTTAPGIQDRGGHLCTVADGGRRSTAAYAGELAPHHAPCHCRHGAQYPR